MVQSQAEYTGQLQRDLELLPLFIQDHGLTSGIEHFRLMFSKPYWQYLEKKELKTAPEKEKLITGSLLLTATLLLHHIYDNQRPEPLLIKDVESEMIIFNASARRQQYLKDIILTAILFIKNSEKSSPKTEKKLMQGIIWIMKEFFSQN